ncbi:HU family DNA-binding protein [Klebsiella aerogenes]|uniref:HU family DNA-binding protein n=1 Tax=Klebsiella aerogenes TaxID=548 RepID=UPI001C2394FF|nr:HU family DNA-binding protein [Klebsiella aerogenes]QXC67250.1 HU family DNA-binding protein [Klebsiella aerogenes]
MNEQLVNELITALSKQTAAQREQTEAINRLAESNVALCDVIIQSLAADEDIEITSLGDERPVYLSDSPRG